MKSNGNWRTFTKEWGPKLGLVGLALLWLTLIASTWADAAENDEYSFNWLDPDKKIYVLQNRKFLKANRLMVSLLGGPGLSNPYRTVFNLDPRLTYHFSEAWGIEGFYTVSFNQPNNTDLALQSATQTLPLIREIRSEAGAMIHWVPWYAKINVFNTILHFDWYFAAGAGVVNAAVNNPHNRVTQANNPYVNESYTSFFWGTGHMYHVTQNFDVRIDLTGAIYHAPVGDGSSAWYSNYNFEAGIGLKL